MRNNNEENSIYEKKNKTGASIKAYCKKRTQMTAS